MGIEVAKIIREDFLQQNAYSDYDYTCPSNKTICMMKCICCFFELATKACLESDKDAKVTWALIESQLNSEIYGLTRLKFELPFQPKAELAKKFDDLCTSIEKKFKNLTKH